MTVRDNIVGNLRRSLGAKIKNYADWQIDMAHREWSVSEDYPDEEKLTNWIPEMNAENIDKYVAIRTADLRRTITDLEAYNLVMAKKARVFREGFEAKLQAYDTAWWNLTDKCNVSEVGIDAAPEKERTAWQEARKELIDVAATAGKN